MKDLLSEAQKASALARDESALRIAQGEANAKGLRGLFRSLKA